MVCERVLWKCWGRGVIIEKEFNKRRIVVFMSFCSGRLGLGEEEFWVKMGGEEFLGLGLGEVIGRGLWQEELRKFKC